MSLAILYSRAAAGIDAPLVTVETHLAPGLVKFNIVGLPEKAVKESRDRVRSAITNSCFEFPMRRITINLAPADLPKEGGRYDLPIALGILAASQQIPQHQLSEFEFLGELALSGVLKPIQGVLPVVLGALQAGRQLIIPTDNSSEAALVEHATVLSAQHLLDVCAYLKGEKRLTTCVPKQTEQPVCKALDLGEVKGQENAKRALEIAAAGGHSLLFIGPPGTGKTMLASRLPSILPPIDERQALEIASIASVSNHGFNPQQWKQLPFRSPHHTSSSAALVGGGRPPRPGEISLAHRGVLFLDELPEFNRHTLECLREPLESGCITISRAALQTIFPACFQLIAAMNPCPCGYAGSTVSYCTCRAEQIQRYRARISGPLLDRIDLHVEVNPVPPELLAAHAQPTTALETSADVLARVIKARERQYQRQAKYNHALTVADIDTFIGLSDQVITLLNQLMTKFNLSARVYHRLLKVARTIADLAVSDAILPAHISEAFHYRALDKRRGKY